MNDFYQVLGISRYASQADIKGAYKKLAKQYHPDKNQGNSYYEEQFKLINEAYHVLADPIKKQQYDAKLQYNFFQTNQNTSQSTSSSTSSDSSTQQKHKKKKPEPPKSNSSFYLITFGFIFLAVFGSIALYYFMSKYSAKTKLQEAKNLIKAGHLRRANLALVEALDHDPSLAEAYYWRGKIIVPLVGKYDLAQQFYTNAISNCDSIYQDAYFERAKTYIVTQQYSNALSDLNILAKLPNPTDSVIWYRAELHYFQDNYSKAATDFETFLSSHPDCGDCVSKVMYSRIQLNQFKQATYYYQKAIESNYDTTKVSNFLIAIAYIGQEDSLLAQRYIQLLKEGSLEQQTAQDALKSLKTD